MRLRTLYLSAVACCAAQWVMPALVAADTVTLIPAKDNTLIESETGGQSNALGDGIFSGRTGAFSGFLRLRAVLAFDVGGAIPPGSTIDSVTLQFFVMSSFSKEQPHTVHLLLADFGEGTSMAFGGQGSRSTPGDATWLHQFYPDIFWTNAGGDFSAAPSASGLIGEFQSIAQFTGAGLNADVQQWLDDPASNFGWIVIGNEDGSNTAKKLGSRDNTEPDQRPQLIIDFTAPAPCPADVAPPGGDQQVNFDDILAILFAWGDCAPGQPPPPCPEDVNGDGHVNFDDILSALFAWGPC